MNNVELKTGETMVADKRKRGYGMTDYKQEIIEMINEIHTERFLKMIYGFVRGMHREEKV